MWVLVAAGIVASFAIGWAAGRAGRSAAPAPPVPSLPAPTPAPTFADLLEDHPSIVVVAAPDATITFRNGAARAFVGTHVGVLLDEAIERHAAVARQGRASSEVLEMYGPPRTVMAVEARPTPDGGAVVFIDDISEQRRIEQVRTDFVANISHELKTPVGAMSVLAETLEDETDPDVVKRVVQRMIGEAERASRTIDDLIELSRIELGGGREVGEVRIADVIRDAVGRVTEMAARRRIRIDTPEAVDEAIVIDGDRRQLVSAVGNLVENAVKYSEPAGVVRIELRRDGNWLDIAVIDHGPGIPQRDLGRIFERFYRVDRARSRATGGTGLGLSIVRHVATNHRGEIAVASVEGEGSTFTLRLPAPGAVVAAIAAPGDGVAPREIGGAA